MSKRRKEARAPAGSSPGTLVIPSAAQQPVIRLMDYNGDALVEKTITDPARLPGYLDTKSITWVDVEGIGNEKLIRQIGEVFGLHPIALEHAVNVPQRPKAESYDNYQLVVTRIARMDRTSLEVETDQVAIFFGANFVLTVQERGGPAFDPVRNRLRANVGPIRKLGTDYLAYALLDTIVDGYFPVLEEIGEYLERVEEKVFNNPQPHNLRSIYHGRRQLLDVRRAIWPEREALSALMREENQLVSSAVRVYLRDVYEHTVQIIDVTETYRELAGNLMEIYLSAVGQRTNEVVKVLTIMSSIFIPLTFIAGVYGMNFRHMPEIDWFWGYPFALLLMLSVALGMVLYFWKRGWLQRS